MKKSSQNNVDLSWKRYIFPAIHPEGLKILLCFVGLFLLLGITSTILAWMGFVLCVFTFYFFRNPDRAIPQKESYVLSPADGVVSNIKPVIPPKELDLGDKPLTRISIFMSVFNVHVNRTPMSGTVHKLNYRPGKFVNISDKDSEDNERQEISLITTSGKKIGVIQIAGLVARRIYCPLKEGQKLKAGERFGMIRFGSRLDVFLPEGIEPKVVLGQIAVAGETILADFDGEQNKIEGVIK